MKRSLAVLARSDAHTARLRARLTAAGQAHEVTPHRVNGVDSTKPGRDTSPRGELSVYLHRAMVRGGTARGSRRRGRSISWRLLGRAGTWSKSRSKGTRPA